ncbi:hypothetical protein BGZ67_009998 [Mortierella alpina]|nr:hypothetical protein BGZ67_009998 [Mortierella alpina]
MRPPFPSAAQAYAESIHSETASRHHPDARLTILPLPSLAALYPLEDSHLSSSSTPASSSPSTHAAADSAYRRPNSLYSSQHQHQHQRQQPSYQSYDKHYQKTPASSSHQFTPSPSPSPSSSDSSSGSDHAASSKSNMHEYLGTNMESLLDAVEVHSNLFASASCASSTGSLSPPPSSLSASAPSSPLLSDRLPVATAAASTVTVTATAASSDSHFKRTRTSSPSLRRMSISNLVDDLQPTRDLDLDLDRDNSPVLEESYRPRLKPMLPRPSSPLLSPSHVTHKRKWSRLSTHTSTAANATTATSDNARHLKVRRAMPSYSEGSDAEVARAFNMSSVASGLRDTVSMRSSGASSSNTQSRPATTTTTTTTTISCYHASVAQKSYGSEKRFLCPPPIVHIQGDLEDPNSGLTSKPQVAMSVICEAGENNTLGQRSTLEDDQSSTFRYLYVSGSAKAKSFQLKLQLYGSACLPNGFVSGEAASAAAAAQSAEGDANGALTESPEPCAVFDSQPIAIISKPSKKTAKARNVSSCILAGSLVSLFNRINSQTVRTKYMSVMNGSLCAKSSTWSAFTISIVANGPSSPAAPRSKSHHRQPVVQLTAAPITYGAEIILTETATGLQSDHLIVCKVENGRILEGAIGPICQMQKVALKSTERSSEDGLPMYLGAHGDDQQGGRFMDISAATNTLLRYETSTLNEYFKPGCDDFLCWTIVGISKFEYAVQLP